MANGTFIADIAHEVESYSGRYRRIGSILYFRSHECKVKITDVPPVGTNVIGKFRPSEKVPEPPMIEGDLFDKEEKVGHIHSQQNEKGDTLYWMRFTKILAKCDTYWLKVKLEDEI